MLPASRPVPGQLLCRLVLLPGRSQAAAQLVSAPTHLSPGVPVLLLIRHAQVHGHVLKVKRLDGVSCDTICERHALVLRACQRYVLSRCVP